MKQLSKNNTTRMNMSNNDVNSLQERIEILYLSTDSFVECEPVAPISIEEEKIVQDDGTTLGKINTGGGTINSEELIKAKHTFTDIISRLANLKDNIKNSVATTEHDPSIVEQYINNSEHLCIVVDLNNAEKHGYPLTRPSRSGKDPKIVNLRKEMSVPFFPGRFTNVFAESTVTFESDIVNKNGELIYYFHALVEQSITDWEDFCIAHLPDKSTAIIKRREASKRGTRDFPS